MNLFEKFNRKCPLCGGEYLVYDGTVHYCGRHEGSSATISIVCASCCTEFRLGEYGRCSFEELCDLWNGKKLNKNNWA